jgi:hypothetical protein
MEKVQIDLSFGDATATPPSVHITKDESVLWYCPDEDNNASVKEWVISFKEDSPFKATLFNGSKGGFEDSGEVRPDVTGSPGESITYPYTLVLFLTDGSVISNDPDVVVDM